MAATVDRSLSEVGLFWFSVFLGIAVGLGLAPANLFGLIGAFFGAQIAVGRSGRDTEAPWLAYVQISRVATLALALGGPFAGALTISMRGLTATSSVLGPAVATGSGARIASFSALLIGGVVAASGWVCALRVPKAFKVGASALSGAAFGGVFIGPAIGAFASGASFDLTKGLLSLASAAVIALFVYMAGPLYHRMDPAISASVPVVLVILGFAGTLIFAGALIFK